MLESHNGDPYSRVGITSDLIFIFVEAVTEIALNEAHIDFLIYLFICVF